MAILLIVHLLATAAMVGLIWFVQIVHYPLFGSVGSREFAGYEKSHQWRTTWVVAPLMLIEAGSSLVLLRLPPTGVAPMLPLIGFALVVLVWLSTLLWQMPAHARLADAYDDKWHRWLVTSNWLRTFAWTARGWIAAAMCMVQM